MGIYNNVTFGEKISFSRADMATRWSDFDSLCATDKEKMAQKAKLWKMPSAAKALKECGDQGLIYWKKLVRDCVYPKPLTRYSWDQKRVDDAILIYCKLVSELSDLVMNSTQIGTFHDSEDGDINAVEWVDSHLMNAGKYTNDARIVVSDRFRYICGVSPDAVRKEARWKRYGWTDEEKIRLGVDSSILVIKFMGHDPEYPDRPTDGAYLRKDGSLVIRRYGSFYCTYTESSVAEHMMPELNTAESGDYITVWIRHPEMLFRVSKTEAEAFSLKETFVNAIVKKATAKPKKNSRKKRFSVTQRGVVQNGGYQHIWSVGGDDFISEFKFRGAEFGNYMSDNDIQQSMDAAYTSLKNLSSILGIDETSISFHGQMGIAFGSRGRGCAAAHYEPGSTDVINLTKMSGAGCLAHEWAHALDRHIADYLGFKSGTLASENKFCDLPDEMQAIVQELRLEMSHMKRYCLDSARFNLVYSKMGNGYWSSRCEMFARAFDCYIEDKLHDAGIKDTYLSGYADSYVIPGDGRDICAFPIGDERKYFTRAFDDLIRWAKEKGVL